MAAAEPTPTIDEDLRRRLAAVLPSSHAFTIFHLSTPPTKTAPLHSAPPHERPDRTYCENHFLAVSIDVPSSQSDDTKKKQVLVLGLEIFIYTTAHSTTLFVSKADSTGYLYHLGLPKGSPSPIREVCAAFVSHLVETRRRAGIQFIVSLFARAQSQYLFPGSVNYHGKHVLDDRGLIKWWCRVLNPLLETPPSAENGELPPWASVKGYLVVPGLDTYETRAFVPRSPVISSWNLTHPLEHISHYTREFDWVPPRCLIPHYPDDPKSRFRDELDEEAAKSGAMQTTGSWKSVKTLDMFWEMMAFRQECSSGRMTGFIWVVFDEEATQPQTSSKASLPTPESSFREESQSNGTAAGPQTPTKPKTIPITAPSTTPRKLFPSKSDAATAAAATTTSSTNQAQTHPSRPSSTNPKKKKNKKHSKQTAKSKKLRGPIHPRKPRIKTRQINYLLLNRPTTSAYYTWPHSGRGERIVDADDYKRIVELLLHLDFATLEKAAGSTKRWAGEVGMGEKWGFEVVGERAMADVVDGQQQKSGSNGVNDLGGLIKRKRADADPAQDGPSKVNVLGAGIIKKKPRETEPAVTTTPSTTSTTGLQDQQQAVNVLGGGLIRKKPKAQ